MMAVGTMSGRDPEASWRGGSCFDSESFSALSVVLAKAAADQGDGTLQRLSSRLNI